MKFGKHLDQALYEPWRDHYVNYKKLKSLLKKLFGEKDEKQQRPTGTGYGSFDRVEDGESCELRSYETKHLEERFIEQLDKEVEKVNSHYKNMEEKLRKSFDAMRAQSDAHGGDNRTDRAYQRSLNISCVGLYRTLNMLNNFVYLNRIGFDKIAKKFDKASKGHYRETFDQRISGTYFATSTGVAEMLRDTAAFFANHFESGDITKAKVRLLAKMTEGLYRKSDMLWLGVKIGIVIMLVFWNMFNLTVSPNLHIKEEMSVYIPLYRSIGLLICLIWMWGFNVWIWSNYRVNHVFIFEISPKHKLNHLEIFDEAASLSIVVLLNSLLFLHHQQYHLRTTLSEIVYPIALIAFIIVKIIGSIVGGGTKHSAQKDIVHSMGSIFIAPFGRARFRDCYLADYFCSMQKIFADLEYSVCLYAIGLSTFSNDPRACAVYCTNLGPILVPLVHALPYWFRFNQCMHRYIETRKRWPNLANAFKYTLCQVSVIIGSLHPFFSEYQAPWSPYRLFWLALIVFTTLYTYFWDIIMDWGLFQFQPGARHPLLRPNRLFPKTLFYYWAICSNLVLRFTWVVTLIPFPFQSVLPTSIESQNILLPTLTLAELFRRSQWGILRVEYEHLSTSQGFRKYKHLPLFFDRAVKREDTLPKSSLWINIEVIFMAFLLVFFSVVVWVLK
ncbi:hypothetical protein AAMO2058_000416400 [Amorphochlora amoebiformis]